MKVLFLDHDGVICLSKNWGSRFKKQKEHYKGKRTKSRFMPNVERMPVHLRFDNFNEREVIILNDIIRQSDCEIVVSSDWRLYCDLEEMGEYYLRKGIIKRPIGFTEVISIEQDPSRAVFAQNRVAEINKWVDDNKPNKWVAIDDLDLSSLDNFILVPNGISKGNLKSKILNYLL